MVLMINFDKLREDISNDIVKLFDRIAEINSIEGFNFIKSDSLKDVVGDIIAKHKRKNSIMECNESIIIGDSKTNENIAYCWVILKNGNDDCIHEHLEKVEIEEPMYCLVIYNKTTRKRILDCTEVSIESKVERMQILSDIFTAVVKESFTDNDISFLECANEFIRYRKDRAVVTATVDEYFNGKILIYSSDNKDIERLINYIDNMSECESIEHDELESIIVELSNELGLRLNVADSENSENEDINLSFGNIDEQGHGMFRFLVYLASDKSFLIISTNIINKD